MIDWFKGVPISENERTSEMDEENLQFSSAPEKRCIIVTVCLPK